MSLIDWNLIHNSEIESGELPVDFSTGSRYEGHILYLKTKPKGTILVCYKLTITDAELCKLIMQKEQNI